MAKRFIPLLLLLLLGQTKPATAPASDPGKPSVGHAATEPATRPADLYKLTPDAFSKLPEAQARIRKDSVDVPLLEVAIFQQSNRERTANKLRTFTHSWAMNLMAREHSKEMSDLRYFDHESPVPANHLLIDRLKNVGLSNVTAGENLAVLPTKEMGSGSYTVKTNADGTETWTDEATGKRLDYYTYAEFAAAVVADWMNSPAHRANLLDKDFSHLGIGVTRGRYGLGQDSFFVTQNFSGSVTDASEAAARAKLNKPSPGH